MLWAAITKYKNVKFSITRLYCSVKLSLLLEKQDEVMYEVNANSDNWMIAGRKRGHVSVSTKQGS